MLFFQKKKKETNKTPFFLLKTSAAKISLMTMLLPLYSSCSCRNHPTENLIWTQHKPNTGYVLCCASLAVILSSMSFWCFQDLEELRRGKKRGEGGGEGERNNRHEWVGRRKRTNRKTGRRQNRSQVAPLIPETEWAFNLTAPNAILRPPD